MGIDLELQGPPWAWVLIGVYVVIVAPFVGGFAQAAIEDWRERRRR